jgi:hypothetical protein
MKSNDQTLQVEITIAPAKGREGVQRRSPAVHKAPTPPRIPRITRLMALAIKFQDMIDRGEVRDYADLARLGYVTRARITQIMNLLNLAPDIQEEILRLDELSIKNVPERRIRLIARLVSWSYQRQAWMQIKTAMSGTEDSQIADSRSRAAVRVK